MMKAELIDWIREIEQDRAIASGELSAMSEEELNQYLDRLMADCDQEEAVAGR